MTAPTLREQALRDAYWAHREVPGRHRGECCQDPCFADITERWVALVTERAAITETHTTTDAQLRAIFPLAPWSSSHLIDLDLLMGAAETVGLRMGREWWVEVLSEYARRRKGAAR